MKKIFFTLITFIVAIAANAQENTVKVYGYDSEGKLNYTPLFISSENVKVVYEKDHEYVDLALPSGTLWATCNIGASKPEEYGDYFAWGEVAPNNGIPPKDEYNWTNYKWSEGSEKSITKYCYNEIYGTVDKKEVLDPEDDAAIANWGNNWCMPTDKQMQELFNYTEQEWTTLNGVIGVKFTRKLNGKSIFLPAAGYRSYRASKDVGYMGCYWTRMLRSSINPGPVPYDACEGYFYMEDKFISINHAARYYGGSIRPVRVQDKK